MIYWLLAREVRILRGELRKDEDWEVLVDLFYYRDIGHVTEDNEDEKEDIAE